MKKHNNHEHQHTDTGTDETAGTNNPFAQEETELPAQEACECGEKYDNLHNQYVRLAADFDNYRKRQASEKEIWLKYGMEKALTGMLDVLDNFDRAGKSCENVNDAQKVKECFGVLEKQAVDVLQKLGLKEIDTKNAEFDPNFHEAAMQTPTSEYKENTIINELQKGYMLGDKVIRPALVNVAVSE